MQQKNVRDTKFLFKNLIGSISKFLAVSNIVLIIFLLNPIHTMSYNFAPFLTDAIRMQMAYQCDEYLPNRSKMDASKHLLVI